MERRDRSVKALHELIYLNSLDDNERAQGLIRWVEKYLTEHTINEFDLELKDLKQLSELFYKNIIFLKEHKESTRQELIKMKKVKSYLSNT